MVNKNIKFCVSLISVSFIFLQLCSSQHFYNLGSGNIIGNVDTMAVNENTNIFSTNVNNPGLEERINSLNYDPNQYQFPTAPKYEQDNDEANSEPEIKSNDNASTQQSKEKNIKNISVIVNGSSNGTFNLFCQELIINAKSNGSSFIQFQYDNFYEQKINLNTQTNFKLNGTSKKTYNIEGALIKLNISSNGASRVIFNIMQGCKLHIESEKTNDSSRISYPNQTKNKNKKTDGFLDDIFDGVENLVEGIGDGIENIFSNSNISKSTSVMGDNSISEINGFKVETINGAIYVNDNLIANSNQNVDTTIDGYKIIRKGNGEVHISSGNNKRNVFNNIGNNSCNIINSNNSFSNNSFIYLGGNNITNSFNNIKTKNGSINIGMGIGPIEFLFLLGLLSGGMILFLKMISEGKNKITVSEKTEIICEKVSILNNNTYNVTGDLTINY